MGYSFERQGITYNNTFQKFPDMSGQKPNKIWLGKSIEFYNK